MSLRLSERLSTGAVGCGGLVIAEYSEYRKGIKLDECEKQRARGVSCTESKQSIGARAGGDQKWRGLGSDTTARNF